MQIILWSIKLFHICKKKFKKLKQSCQIGKTFFKKKKWKYYSQEKEKVNNYRPEQNGNRFPKFEKVWICY